MRILIAPNAMKGSLSATDFADAIAEGLFLADNTFDLIRRPLADGGDGTLEILLNAMQGIFIPVGVHDPLGRKRLARFGWVEESKCAVIEMAEASGHRLLQAKELNPMIASSYGTGELMLAAVKQGARKIILALGGSATIDGGTGMLKAMGCRITDADGNEISQGGNGLIAVSAIETDHIIPELLNCEIIIASDVKNQLLGAEGAAPVFGPQKGATPPMIGELEKGLENFVNVLEKLSGKDLKGIAGGGAAGGVAVPLLAFFNARIEVGARFIGEQTGVFRDIVTSNLVITGEGCIDLQTCHGKGPAIIAEASHKAGIPVIAIGGSVAQGASYLFDGIFSITSGPVALENAVKNAFELTKAASYEIGKLMKSIIR